MKSIFFKWIANTGIILIFLSMAFVAQGAELSNHEVNHISAPTFLLEVNDDPNLSIQDIRTLNDLSFKSISNSFSTVPFRYSYLLKITLLKFDKKEKFSTVIQPSFASNTVFIYSKDVLTTEKNENLLTGMHFPLNDNYFEFTPKADVRNPVIFLYITRKITPIMSINVLNGIDIKKEMATQEFHAGFYIGMLGLLLLVILFFYTQYKKTCLITLWVVTFFSLLNAIFRNLDLVGEYFPSLPRESREYLYLVFIYIIRTALGLFLFNFIYEFSRSRLLKLLAFFNFLICFIALCLVSLNQELNISLYSLFNSFSNLLLIICCLSMELTRLSRNMFSIGLVYTSLFFGAFIFAVLSNIVDLPQDIPFYKFEWYRILYTLSFLYILYKFYSQEKLQAEIAVRESELLYMGKLHEEIQLRQDQEALNNVVSHEIKTPLTAIYFLIDRLESLLQVKSSAIDSTLFRLKTLVQQINSVSDRFTWLTKFNSFENLKITNNINLADLVNGIVEILPQKKQFSVIHDDGAFVNSDLFCLTTILQNIIDNSVKYCSEQSIIHINIFPQDKDHVQINIRNKISSHGIDTNKIFEKYYRGPGSGGKAGLGIGLWLVNQIADQIGVLITPFLQDDEIIFSVLIPIDIPA
jgi:signal transduction histidine kinase